MPLLLVLLADRRLEGIRVSGAPGTALLLDGLLTEEAEHGCGLLTAHDRDARIRPHEQEARAVGAAAHAVVAGAVAATDDHGVFCHVAGTNPADHPSPL